MPTMTKLLSHKPDNGEMHYGAGLKGSLCGVEVKGRRETSRRSAGVTCKECLRLLKQRP